MKIVSYCVISYLVVNCADKVDATGVTERDLVVLDEVILSIGKEYANELGVDNVVFHTDAPRGTVDRNPNITRVNDVVVNSVVM